MVDIATLVKSTKIRKAIRMFQWMSKDRFVRVGEQPATLLDDGSSDLLLDGDLRDLYPRRDLGTLDDLGFLQNDGRQFKLTDKAERLVEALEARKAGKADLVGPPLDWIVVAHAEVFIDEGATPPNLGALIGAEWNPGDRIVITCHNPEHALVSHLPLALAGCDPMFVADLQEVTEDFKYADAEGEAQ